MKKLPIELSDERQRVVIARTFRNESDIILRDKPTVNLYSNRAFEVAQNLLQK